MKIEPFSALAQLCCEQQCLGAMFTSFSFDPEFFEKQVLRTVLAIDSDPVEQPQRYYAEALRALQETPVAVIVDAGQRQPGRRLPYDLLDIHQTVFHPKSVLLVYDNHSRLMIGSGNLTLSGYSGNLELFLALDLHYDNENDVALLHDFDQYLNRIHQLAQSKGRQFSLVREALQRRIGNQDSSSRLSSYILLDSTKGPITEQILNSLPENATIDRIGMLAPFYELDDGRDLDSSIFGAFESRASEKNLSLDVAVCWDNPQINRESGQDSLERGIHQLWAWKTEKDDKSEVEYLVPTAIKRSTMQYVDHRGKSMSWDLQDARDAIEDGVFWMLPKPLAYAPRKSLKKATEVYSDVRLWLHPTTRLIDGHLVNRPLHAKLLLVGFRDGKTSRTLVVMGSANMSRRALLQSVDDGGNVELGVAFILDGDVGLKQFLPALVSVPMALLDLKEREFLDAEKNWSIAINEAVYDPTVKTLRIFWCQVHAVAIPPWRLLYQDKELAASDAPPVSPTTILDFDLQPSMAEIVLRVADQEFSIPILVTDLIALPIVAGGNGLDLFDILLLLGRRIGSEQAIHRSQSRLKGDSGDLNEIFGTSFCPTDVFRAWWTVGNDLQDGQLSLMAFRLQLEGSLSTGYAWQCMIDAAKTVKMNATEVWFYGAELLRELEQVELPETPDRDAKQQLLEGFKQRLQKDLDELSPSDSNLKWVKTIQDFYSGVMR